MNFFANFGRVNTTPISKITVKSHKLCVKTSFWYIPVIFARIFNQQGSGERRQRFPYVAEGGAYCLTLRTVTRVWVGRAKFSPKTVLRSVWMIPKVLTSKTYRRPSRYSQGTNTKNYDLFIKLYFKSNSPCITYLFLSFTGITNIYIF